MYDFVVSRIKLKSTFYMKNRQSDDKSCSKMILTYDQPLDIILSVSLHKGSVCTEPENPPHC